MLVLSPAMEAYEKSLMDDLLFAIAIAKKARSRGLDPSTDIEIPIASDLADRVEALLGIKGVAERIRELESLMSREEVALRIGDDFVARKFGETTNEQILDHAIRTAMALLTEGVVAAPTEGIAKVGLGKNDDGSQYPENLLRRANPKCRRDSSGTFGTCRRLRPPAAWHQSLQSPSGRS